MRPQKPLPYPELWANTEEYVENLLEFATTSDLFQILCGGVHILDFFTSEPGLFHTVIPEEWRMYLIQTDPMRFLDLLMRDDLDNGATLGTVESDGASPPPESLIIYIRQIRKFSLARDFSARQQHKLPKLTRPVSVGMKPKKVHEVSNFAYYVDQLAENISPSLGGNITHFVDFGSGQNYLGRALASAPYNRQIVAVEGREHNIAGAKELDLFAGVVEKPKVMRNKKLWMQKLDSMVPAEQLNAKAQKRAEKMKGLKISDDLVADFRPLREIGASYEPEDGKGHIRYIEGRLESGDLTDVITQLENDGDSAEASSDVVEEKKKQQQIRLMAVSIHSCGNLSHHGIRSLIMNPRVEAIAIVGCCYNLVTEKLGPPTYKHPYMRPSLQALNGRVVRESAKKDPQGFPMSQRLCDYKDAGIRLNITARMMACQAPQNWTDAESDGFFTRHFYRAVLQKLFLDKGVINKVYYKQDGEGETTSSTEAETPFNTSTNPVIIGSLRKTCYNSFNAYVHGAIAKLTTNGEYHEYCDVVREKMGDITDEEIARYEAEYAPRKRELSAVWSLMAFSAVVVESLIVTDRYLFLKQHDDLVQDCWIEPVFDYQQSPRNLVVVGVKRSDAAS
ncbi:methyltransferase domain-domain-containing protein [Microdochium bolleyi]|uniref:Methyltransferase domain-domain-containing protein n=1 Tax=Microdochium bolleyi TaxID=196109 RepID=A0A136J671_9PEZI|nr:methyltransferase domain-domain-containing protein [Microdochium bolleyi]